MYTIENLKTYPQDGKHQKVVWNIFMPFDIVKGNDNFPNDNNKEKWKKTHWWVCPKTQRDICNVHDISMFMNLPSVREFKTVEKAVEFCLNWKETWLKQQTDELFKLNENKEKHS
jgi:hypothetical protein